MKADRDWRVPLSDAAIAILGAMQAIRHSDYVFPALRGKDKPISEQTILRLVKATSGREDMTTHGLRSCFRDWQAECTTFPNEMGELALGHAVSDETEAAYRRGDMFQKRVTLMQAWADYCGNVVDGNKVVAFRGGH
jgi:integrase